METFKIHKTVELSESESNLLTNKALKIQQSQENNSSNSGICSSILSGKQKGSYVWCKQEIRLVWASKENSGNLGSTDCLLSLVGSQIPPTMKKRIGFLSTWGGISVTKNDHIKSDSKFDFLTIFSVVEAFLGFLKILHNLIGTAIKSWNDFMSALKKEDEDNMSKSYLSESELKDKKAETPAKILPTIPSDTLPSKPLSNLAEMANTEIFSVKAVSRDQAGFIIYLYSEYTKRWSQLVDSDSDFSKDLLKILPDSNSVAFEFPPMTSSILIYWANKPESNNSPEIGSQWGKIYVAEEN